MSVLELRRMARNRHTNIKLTDTANKKKIEFKCFSAGYWYHLEVDDILYVVNFDSQYRTLLDRDSHNVRLAVICYFYKFVAPS